jgi:hypothetical protein
LVAEATIGLVWAVGERTQLRVNVGGASDGDTAASVYGGVGGASRF